MRAMLWTAAIVIGFGGVWGSPRAAAAQEEPVEAAAPQEDAPETPVETAPIESPVRPVESSRHQDGNDEHEDDEAPLSNVRAPNVEWLEFGGQFRTQFEYRDPASYVVPGTFGLSPLARGNADDDAVLMRTRLHANAQIEENLRVFVQLQDFRFWGAEAPPALATSVDDEGVDIHQAFVEIENLFDRPFGLKIGRQELSYGDQRLVSPLDWRFRAFDAIKGRYEGREWWIDVFASNVLEGSSTGRDRMFNGAYVSIQPDDEGELDFYLFQRLFGDRTFAGETGGLSDLEDYTLGVRYARKTSTYDVSAEADYQFGTRGGDRVEAYAYAIKGGVILDESKKLRLGAGWDFATGDDDPTDGRSGTFVPLFPFGHYFQGFYDIFSWSNGHDLYFSGGFSPIEELHLQLDWHNFWLDDTQDAWYSATGAPLRRDPTGKSRHYVGSEFDLHARWSIREQMQLWFGYSFFQPGTYVRDTGSAPVGNFLFAQLTVNF